MNKPIKELFEFIDRAEKSRKYPPATAKSLVTALRLFEAELNEDERNSIDLFKKNLEQIYHSVTVNNGKSMSAGSLATYKSRVKKVLTHYEKYGVDPTKMAGWNPTIITRKSKKKSQGFPDVEEKKELSAGIGVGDNFIFDFDGGVKLVIPKTPETNEAIMDGELKEIKSGLKKFAEKFCERKEGPENGGGA